MKKLNVLVLFSVLVFGFTFVNAQVRTTQQPITPIQNAAYHQNNSANPAPVVVTIFSGTPIELETMYPINGKNVRAGQTLDLRVKYDLVINGQKVISAGAPAKVIVSVAKNSKMMGKGGELELLPQYVQTVDGQFLAVTGMPANFDAKGRKGLAWGGLAAGAVTGGVGFLVLPFIKGKTVEVPAGTSIQCSVLGERNIYMTPIYR